MIKNIKLPVVVSTVKVLFQFRITFRNRKNRMFIDLLSESGEEGGGISLLGNKDESIVR